MPGATSHLRRWRCRARVDVVETDSGRRVVRPQPTHIDTAMLTNTSLHLTHVASVRPATDGFAFDAAPSGDRARPKPLTDCITTVDDENSASPVGELER